MRITVLGGAGFIGSHLVDVLMRSGHETLVIDNLSKGRRENIAGHEGEKGFAFYQEDVLNRERLFELVPETEAVVHLVAHKIPRYESALKTLTLNTRATINALDLAKERGARFILASTSDVYGKSPDQPFREDGDLVLGPSVSRRWAYAVSKIYDEHLTIAYGDEFGLDYVILRYFGTYGPRQYLNWWGGPQGVFLDAIFKGKEIELHGDGKQTRCFIYVEEAAEATLRAITTPEAGGEIINIGNPEEISIADLARLMHRLSGLRGEPRMRFVPYSSFTKNYEDPRRRVPDISKMKGILGYEPKISLVEGLERTIAWYRKEHLGK
ncbi:MAG: NAD-dependent epimerase/dehydratase family protein [candidate division WOR-3 bacterium]